MNYKEALASTEAEMAKLLEERESIDARLNLLKVVAQAYSALLTDGSTETRLIDLINQAPAEPGITNSIRQVLASSKLPLSAPEIKSALEDRGVDLSGYANPGAVIHNTLTRLEKQKEVMRVQNPAGQTVSYALVKSSSFYKRLFEL